MSDSLPTAGMGGYKLEEFIRDLLKRMERVPGAIPRLVASARNGTSGQEQDGIDHRGRYSDGTTLNIQSKDQQTLPPADIKKIVKDVEDADAAADKNVIVFSRIASARARAEVVQIPKWEIWDRADLEDHVRSLLPQDVRALLDTHFGRLFRQGFLPIAGTDAFLLLDDHFAPLLGLEGRFHHRGGLVGRDGEVSAIISALTDPDGPRVVMVEGPAGRGKSRVALEALRQVQDDLKPIPVLVRADGVQLDSSALDELPQGPAIVLVEDVHRDPGELAVLLRYARRTDGVRLVLTMRSYAKAAVQQVVLAAQFDLSHLVIVGLRGRFDTHRDDLCVASGWGSFYGFDVDSDHSI